MLNENHEAIKAIEAKLCTGAPLTPYEQAVYDGNSGVAEEKIAWLQVCVCVCGGGGEQIVGGGHPAYTVGSVGSVGL